MADNEQSTLPASGLAEDILARFMEKDQPGPDDRPLDETGVEGNALHLVTFYLDREEYGVEIKSVQEIIRATDVTPVPGAPEHVRGVINLRGKIIPVVDLRKRFNLPPVSDTAAQRVIVVELDKRRLGMLVDAVSQVVKLPSEIIENIPEEAVTADADYIRGVGKLDNRLIMILDLNCSLLLSARM